MICEICKAKYEKECPNKDIMAHKRLKEWKEQGMPGKDMANEDYVRPKIYS